MTYKYTSEMKARCEMFASAAEMSSVLPETISIISASCLAVERLRLPSQQLTTGDVYAIFCSFSRASWPLVLFDLEIKTWQSYNPVLRRDYATELLSTNVKRYLSSVHEVIFLK